MRAGINSTRSSASSSRASRASSRWPRWGGLKVPPRIPTDRRSDIAAVVSIADVSVALDEILERAQLTQSDWPARMELLCGVPDLGTHPELAAVGEARGRVHVDTRRIHSELERSGGRRVARHDRLGVPAAIAADVLDGLLDAVDDPHGDCKREILRRPVLLGRVLEDRSGDRLADRAVALQRQYPGALIGAY